LKKICDHPRLLNKGDIAGEEKGEADCEEDQEELEALSRIDDKDKAFMDELMRGMDTLRIGNADHHKVCKEDTIGSLISDPAIAAMVRQSAKVSNYDNISQTIWLMMSYVMTAGVRDRITGGLQERGSQDLDLLSIHENARLD